MLDLLGMSLERIGRFVEEQTVDFASLSQFIQVDALNNNTGGSSGSGKSTLFNALDYLLGLNDIPSTVLQCRYSEEHMVVSGSFLWNGEKVEITRGKKLRVKIGDTVTEGSSALAEEKIDMILGMPRKIFRKLLHKRQKEGGFFIDMTASQKHEFLIDCLDLSIFRKFDDAEDTKIKDLTAKKASEQSLLDGQIQGLQATRDAIEALGLPPVKEVDQEMILSLKKKLDEASEGHRLANLSWIERGNELEKERPNTKVVPFDRTNLDKYSDEILSLNQQLNALFQADKDRIAAVRTAVAKNKQARKDAEAAVVSAYGARQETVRLADEIKKIRAAICPTCEQTWVTEQYSAQERERLTQILRLKIIIDAGTKAVTDLETLNYEATELEGQDQGKVPPEMPGLNEQLREAHANHLAEKLKGDADIARQNSANSAEIAKFTQRTTEFATRANRELEQYRNNVDLQSRVFEQAVAKFKAYDDARLRYQNTFDSLKTKEHTYGSKIAEHQLNLVNISNDLSLAEDTKKAIKTFLSYSFDDALNSIGDRATKIIRCIPNMSNATIQFDGTKETKDGKVKEEVNAVIGMDGEEAVPIRSLSGGERSAVDIAVDLAVIDFIESKSGKGINLFILDEPFTGLGPVEIEMALEVLKNSNTNKKIVIVDHNSEVKQMVQDRLIVVRDGLVSKIEKSA